MNWPVAPVHTFQEVQSAAALGETGERLPPAEKVTVGTIWDGCRRAITCH